MTTITITQMIRMRTMTFVQTYNQERHSLQLMVMQIFHELQRQMNFALACLVLSFLFDLVTLLSTHTESIREFRVGRADRSWGLGYIGSIRGLINRDLWQSSLSNYGNEKDEHQL